jgi:Epoxide hydrolase N terminus
MAGAAPGDDWTSGVPVEYLRSLTTVWREEYDWRASEARLNEFPQFVTEIDGARIHFLHVRSPIQARLRWCCHTAGRVRFSSSSTLLTGVDQFLFAPGIDRLVIDSEYPLDTDTAPSTNVVTGSQTNRLRPTRGTSSPDIPGAHAGIGVDLAAARAPAFADTAASRLRGNQAKRGDGNRRGASATRHRIKLTGSE